MGITRLLWELYRDSLALYGVHWGHIEIRQGFSWGFTGVDIRI